MGLCVKRLGRGMLLWGTWVNGCYCRTFWKMDVTVGDVGKWMLLWNILENGCYCGTFG